MIGTVTRTTFASPVSLLIVIWAIVLLAVAVGPIDYPGEPSMVTLAIVGVGILLFSMGHALGGKGSGRRMPHVKEAVSLSRPRYVIAGSAVAGMIGISLIAFDRHLLSGIGSHEYAQFLRCAPEFIDYIEVRRTPLLYLGYMLFSFGFASTALFLLRAEEIRGWPAYLAQLAIIVPIGYALIYSGRMPILLLMVHIVGIGMVRLYQGRTLVPRGHYLILKLLIFGVLFASYVNLTWIARRDFCHEQYSTIERLRTELIARPASQGAAPEKIAAPELSKLIAATRSSEAEAGSAPAAAPKTNREIVTHYLVEVMTQAWGVRPRGYVLRMLERETVPPRIMIGIMSSYFYLTHGLMTLDRIWAARDGLRPVLGVYQVGVLSPMLRVISPNNKILIDMKESLVKAKVYGFFPSIWGAALVDFGLVGGGLYILIWGILAGRAYRGSRSSGLITPPLLLSFILATILLSPLQGPLGTANSALVLGSLLVTGILADFALGRREADLAGKADASA